jgi:catechol 2,3-dioxygenase-like lactoylglutathione lyase family enzyme
MLTHFDHAVIAVTDLDAATRQYTELFGLTPSWRGIHPEAGTSNTLYRVANGYVELLAPTGDGPIANVVEGHLDEHGEGMFAVCFAAADADAFAAALRRQGIDAVGPQAGEGREETGEVVRRWRTVLLPREATRGLMLFAIEHETPDALLPLAKPTLSAESAVSAIDHVVVTSPDIDASGALYGDLLGLRLSLDRSFEGRGLRMKFFRVGGATIEVVGRLDAEPDAAATDSFGGLAYQVPDIDAVRERLVAAFDVSEIRDGHKPDTRVCTVRDGTRGVPTLLIEPSTPFRA